jgi:succinoglycan biosynthesis transport protein ExoP
MNSGVQSDTQGDQMPAGGFAFGDILFTLFRHKFLILAGVLFGLVAALVVRYVKPPNYESTAQIYVPYIVEPTLFNPADPDSPMRTTGGGGDIQLNTEVDTLKSFDTALEVARRIGPERVLERYGGGSNLQAAAGVVASGIYVNPPKTMSLTLTFSHRDAELVQPAMETIVEVYMARHLEIRRGRGNDIFTERSEEARKKLESIEKEITALKTNAGVPDIRERLRAVAKEYAEIETRLLKTQTELASRKAELGAFASLTNAQSAAIPPETIGNYSDLITQIEEIKKRQRTLLLDDVTTNHPSYVKLENRMRIQIQQKMDFEKQYPTLTNYISAPRTRNDGATNVVRMDLESEWADINKQERTMKSDQAVLITLKEETFRLMDLEPKLSELERRRDAVKKDYEYLISSVDTLQKDDDGRGGAIYMKEMQKPTPPRLDKKKMLKFVGAAFGGFVGLGLGIAFLIDMVLDRSIRRPAQILRELRLPVILTIPDANRGEASFWPWTRRNRNLKMMRPDKHETAEQSSTAVAPWSPDNHLQSHIEGLRERVITHFEVKHAEHNPKLVAVTACMDGAGVTTLASGLAATLSRTGSGSVLLVDMNHGEGVTHSFYKGKPGYGPAESIETDSESDSAEPSEKTNLSLTKHTSREAKQDRQNGLLPSGFNNMSPKLKATAYDYIVFDMTAITPASVTPRLSGHMDLVLFVIESEKTKDYSAKHACGLMRDARANVVAILNKYHNPVPAWLAHE